MQSLETVENFINKTNLFNENSPKNNEKKLKLFYNRLHNENKKKSIKSFRESYINFLYKNPNKKCLKTFCLIEKKTNIPREKVSFVIL